MNLANTKYFLAENYKHHKHEFFPKKPNLKDFPVCSWCGADIYVDDYRKEWACSNPSCRLS